MSCIHLNAPQGSNEWFQERVGAITASMFAECRKVVGGLDERQQKFVDLVSGGKSKQEAKELAGYKAMPSSNIIERALDGQKVGDYSEQAKAYAFKLAVERISGEMLDEPQFDPWQARRGRELEPEARLLYEERKQVLVEQTGLAVTEDRRFGVSLDGLVDDDGSVEIKCFLAPSKVCQIILEHDISDTVDQMQGGNWITGRKWTDFVLYFPSLKSIGKELTIIRTYRDDDYINPLQDDLMKFNGLVEQYVEKLKAA